MRRPRSIRLLVAAGLAGAAALTSGCVGLSGISIGPQADVIGDFPVTLTVCASGSTGCVDSISNLPALPGTGQILVGVRVQANVSVPAFMSPGPEALAFTDSPSYAAELERLDPAAPGTHWVGLISAVTNYSNTAGPQSVVVPLAYRLGQGADGSPFPGPLATEFVVGGRGVTAASPGSRPVSCGASLSTVFDEDPSPTNDVYAICKDAGGGVTSVVRNLGVLAGAPANGSPGGLAAVPFTLRFAGSAFSLARFVLTATTTLPGASLGVTPGDLAPATDSDSQALVAVGIPAGARAGSYGVTLTARLANGQTRSRTGTLTVTGGVVAAAEQPAEEPRSG